MRRLLTDQVSWLWLQLADIADRRGDVDLVDGAASVTAPREAASRAESMGLLGRRTLAAGQTVRVELSELTRRLRIHDPALTPGLVAAHAARRRLAVRARAAEHRRDENERLRQRMAHVFDSMPLHAPVRPDISRVWPVLQRTGWVARILAADDVGTLLEQAAMVIAGLPETGRRRDRRRLADAVTGNPHALDQGLLPGLVLVILVGTEALTTAMAPRDSWAAIGVDCDDLTGGLLALGIHPRGWSLPHRTVLTIPPRELLRCSWPDPPGPSAFVYVTENPSVMTAAADYAENSASSVIRLLCTVGTPSVREIEAIARLSAAGWKVAVRADFDEAGLLHVGALLNGVPGAIPWRMGVMDYLASLKAPAGGQVPLRGRAVPPTEWDPRLQQEMNERGLAAFEETLIDVLIDDLTRNG